MAKPAGSRRGGARFAAPGYCSPNRASHRGFGTFEGIVCRDISRWRMIHGASHPNAGRGSVLLWWRVSTCFGVPNAHIPRMATIVRCNCGAEYKRAEAKFLVPHTGHASCKVCGATLESWLESTHGATFEPVKRPDGNPGSGSV